MNLTSCDNCGVVLDKDKLYFDSGSRKYLDSGEVDTSKYTWDGEDYIAFVKCPVCQSEVTQE